MSDLPLLSNVLPLPEGVRLYAQAMVFDHPLQWSDYESLYTALNDIRQTAKDNVPYWLGDLLNEIEMVYGETYAQLIDSLDFESIGTLRNYKWVCGKVPPAMRLEISPRNDILFTLSKIAAPIQDPNDRKMALAAAVRDDLTTREFQARVHTPSPPRLLSSGINDKQDLEDALNTAFEAVARQDWEEASAMIDKALILLRRL